MYSVHTFDDTIFPWLKSEKKLDPSDAEVIKKCGEGYC